jgi:hypothetical protein
MLPKFQSKNGVKRHMITRELLERERLGGEGQGEAATEREAQR